MGRAASSGGLTPFTRGQYSLTLIDNDHRVDEPKCIRNLAKHGMDFA